jgi:hypothetical protein
MTTVELTIVCGTTEEDIRELALLTHGGNYQGDPGPFFWSHTKAINTIRHCLTNYEQQWQKKNRGNTGAKAYNILRKRVDDLVEEAYPQFFK